MITCKRCGAPSDRGTVRMCRQCTALEAVATSLATKPEKRRMSRIVKRRYYRTSSHPRNAGDSVIIELECGEERHYKASGAPKPWTGSLPCKCAP